MMHHLSSSVSKRILCSVMVCCRNGSSCFSMVSKQSYRSSTLQQIVDKSPRNAIPSDFLKWHSLGSIRTSKFASGFNPLKQKPLDSIIDTERAKDKSAEELADIWDDYHLGRGHIAASMKAKLYKLLEQRASSCRYFVIPLWKGSGYTTMFVQVLVLCKHQDRWVRDSFSYKKMLLTELQGSSEIREFRGCTGTLRRSSRLTAQINGGERRVEEVE